jgi:hypothetical protein
MAHRVSKYLRGKSQMTEFDAIETAHAAVRRFDFKSAEAILVQALSNEKDPPSRDALLLELFLVYFHPSNENVERAQWCLEQKEAINPSAENALQWVSFMLQCKRQPKEAQTWARIAVQRAEAEARLDVLYTAVSRLGFLAAQQGDLPAVTDALKKLSSLVDRNIDLPFGDEVPFLEAGINLEGEIRIRIKQLAKHIAVHIENPEYRARAESVAHA